MPEKAQAQAQAQGEKAAAESYEKRQMLWKGMAGRSWSELVQQWGVPQVEALQLPHLSSMGKNEYSKIINLSFSFQFLRLFDNLTISN